MDKAKFEEALSYALLVLEKSHVILKKEQRQTIWHAFHGVDVFSWLPTGFGKSLCYQVLPFMSDYCICPLSPKPSQLVIVISPLISLMTDQVQSLRRIGVRASLLTASDSSVDTELIATKDDLSRCSLLYCAPESLLNQKWRDVIEMTMISGRIVAIAVDEAHCISKWSKEFRPAYGKINEIRAFVPPGIPIIACTATATKSVRQEVVTSLEMTGCHVISASPDRPNIFYEVHRKTEFENDLQFILSSLKKLRNKSPRVIVYCRTLDVCSDLYAHFLYELGRDSYFPDGAEEISDNRIFEMYHSTTPQHNKDVIMRSLTNPDGLIRVVFATIAMGMGVNFTDINLVIHYGAPQSLDDYFQESGRCGRSGDDAKSVVYWRPAECPARKELKTARDTEVMAVRRYLENTSDCRRKRLLAYFDPDCAHSGPNPSRCCDVCVSNSNNKIE